MTLRERASAWGPALIRDLVRALGGQAAAARAVGCSQPAVCGWLQARPRATGWVGYPRTWAMGPEWDVADLDQLLARQADSDWPVARLDRLVQATGRARGWVQLLMRPGRPHLAVPASAASALLAAAARDAVEGA